jgi:flagellar biogenesis protein FliO
MRVAIGLCVTAIDRMTGHGRPMVVGKSDRQFLCIALVAVLSTAAVARAQTATAQDPSREPLRDYALQLLHEAADEPRQTAGFDESQAIGSISSSPARPDGEIDSIESTGSPWVLNTITALGLVVGLILLLRAMFNKLSGGRAVSFSPSRGKAVEVLSRTAIAPRQHVTILRVGHRVLVVGDGGGQMNTLADIADPDEIAAILKALAAGSNSSITQSFHQMVERFSDKHHQRDAAELEGRDAGEHDTDRARDEVSGLLSRLRAISREVA